MMCKNCGLPLVDIVMVEGRKLAIKFLSGALCVTCTNANAFHAMEGVKPTPEVHVESGQQTSGGNFYAIVAGSTPIFSGDQTHRFNQQLAQWGFRVGSSPHILDDFRSN